jgi:hypothetical protein
MKLQKVFAAVSIAALALLPVAALAAEGKEVTVKGEILDLACYVAHDAQGDEHVNCALRCVKAGQPMGLKAEDGTVYILFADHADASAYEQAKQYAGKVVEISGPAADRAGLKGITVQSVKQG